MKFPPLAVACLLALACLLFVLFAPVPNRNKEGAAETPPDGEASTPARFPRPEEAVPARSGGPVPAGESKPVDVDLVRDLAQAEDSELALPGGAALAVQVTRRLNDRSGRPVMVEGTVSQPAAGRFLFRLQPEGVLPGPMVGFIFYPTLDYGYLVETVAGRSWLVRRPVDQIACVGYAPPVGEETEEIPADHPTGIPIPAYQNGVIPLQSLPGAVGVLYLDFDGEQGPHEGWGDFDAAAFTLSTAQIFEVWRRVAEDFAPFNLNVTTDLQVYLDAPETSRQRCIITPTTTAAPGAGGVAFLNSFNSAGDRPCWAFYGSGKSAAEVISHEFGHTLQLSHDGRISPAETYYGGHGSGVTGWGPIMGVGYYQNLTQWSKGEYLSANQTQDDLVRITSNNNLVDFRADDHGGSHATASPLDFTSGGQADAEGNIETNGDVDAFLFTTAGGALNLSIDPVTHGPNVDLLAELYDGAGALLQSSNPDTLLDATLDLPVAAGTYTVRITNTGKGDPLGTGYTGYASLGQYTITGSIAGAVLPARFTVAENAPNSTVVGTVSPRSSHGASPLVWSIVSGNGAGAFQINAGTGQITVANSALLDVEALSAGWHDPPLFDLQVAITDTLVPALNEEIRTVIEVLNVNEAPSLTGGTVTILEHTRVGRGFFKMSYSDPDQFDVPGFAITAGNTSGRFAVDANGVLSPAADLAFATQSSYTLTVTATDSGSPALTASATVTVNLLDTAEGYVPGRVEHTFYRGISGTAVSNLTGDPDFPNCPDDIEFRDELHANEDGDNYGRTVRAYLIPHTTGNHTFWIAGDAGCELRLSTSANPGSAAVIASFSGSTNYQQWTKYSGQKSAVIPLVAGQAYYLEARQKESSGADHLSVAWEVRNAANTVILVPQEPIPGLFLAPHALNYCPRLAAASATVRDNAYPGSLLRQFTATDLNPADTHSYAITGGNAAGKFGIDPSTGKVTLADPTALASSYLLTITATDNGTPALSSAATLTVNVLPGATVAAAEPLLEIWDGLSGTSLTTLTTSSRFPDRPDRLVALASLDSGQNLADNYGARIRAYVTPPVTGAYTFYLASDDNGSLLLSTNDNPASAVQIASIPGYSGYLQWTKYPSQTSAAINLTGGQRYFLEARVKEGGGGDHLTVGWTGPGIATTTVIGAAAIEPYDSNVAPTLSPLNPVLDLGAGAPAGATLATLVGVDSPFETKTFAIRGGNDGGAFAIDPQSGKLTLANPAVLHTGPYALTIGVQDSGHGAYFPLRETTTGAVVHVGDADHDALPDGWEIAQFGDLIQSGSTDTDLDGYSNRSEFLFGSDGDLFSSFPRGPRANGVSAPGAWRFEMTVRKNLAPGAYDLYVSDDLDAWSLLEAPDYSIISTTPVDADHNRITLEVLAATDQCFLKAGVD